MSGRPDTTTQTPPVAQNPDQGPAPSNAPVPNQPGSPPATNPALNPSAPPNGPVGTPFSSPGVTPNAPTGNPGDPPPAPPAPNTNANVEDPSILAAFNESDPGEHLRGLLNDGLLPSDDPWLSPQPPAAPAGQPAPTQQPQAPGTVPGAQPQQGAPPSGQDPLLARLFQAAPPAAPMVGPTPAWPQQPAPPPQPAPTPTQQPQGGPPSQPDASWTPFAGPVTLPPHIRTALESEDPNARIQAMELTLAAFGNHVAQMVETRITQHHLPQVQQRTLGAVEQGQSVRQVQNDVFGAFPQLRHASPALLQECARVVIQDEMSRNPMATYTSDMGKRIGQLAFQALQQTLGGGQPAPVYQPQPAPQPQPAYQPPPGYVLVPQPQPQLPPPPPGYVYAPAPGQNPPASQPWMSGPTAGGMGYPAPMQPTPEGEMASFFQGGWEPQ